ncbi:MAG TPA: hypothetical protein VK464_28520 [Symbiobacteriaceae bacterium]|jgi:tetratricopeptide (TPR) repeat protein|nr:hypothetical protein [Symbiobacteriaceae bacterium]
MKLRKRLLFFVVGMVTLLLAGCSAQPATPDAAASAARAFLEARAQHDAAAVFNLLSERTQKVLPQAEVARVVRRETVAYSALGSPEAVEGQRVRVPVTDLVVATPERTLRMPEARLTLEYNGRRWGVAWVEPVADKALLAYQNSRYGDELDLAHAIADMDPYHYRGALEAHFAYRGLKRLREAELAIARARELALPSQAAGVEESFARFKLSLGRPDDAVPLAQHALDLAAPYTPYLYSQRWTADTWVLLGHALLAGGDRTGAESAAKQAEALDPQNAELAMLRYDLAPR